MLDLLVFCLNWDLATACFYTSHVISARVFVRLHSNMCLIRKTLAIGVHKPLAVDRLRLVVCIFVTALELELNLEIISFFAFSICCVFNPFPQKDDCFPRKIV